MKIFSCSKCGQVVFFENVRCTRCASPLAYLPDQGIVSAMVTSDGALVATAPKAKGAKYRLCKNSDDYGVCNWAVAAGDDDPYCLGCRLNDVIPNLSQEGALLAWNRIEHAKKRMLYALYELGLPVDSHAVKKGGLVFSFLASDAKATSPVLTGHDDGHITLNIAEADNPGRERLREQLGENYRTLLGHFRHEIGHYYWDVLIRDTDRLPRFRDLFGDPDKSYAAELERHYKQGPPPNWQESFVSTYATMHPWEDWAETWAHYLHIVDTLGTARSYGMALKPEATGLKKQPHALRVNAREVDFDDFEDLIGAWFPLTFALNSLNRGMGLPDMYPFVLSERAIEKLHFVHDVIEHAHAARTSG
ncbi:MAG TPA: putative zinc-binding metallopeptidase [Polyangiaceae bacterium]|jgi:hypothetical protein|nr:putative zinc-binding metallopeptidase [Polyangiaceae bacterium]